MLYKIEVVDKPGIFNGSTRLTINSELGRRIDAVGQNIRRNSLSALHEIHLRAEGLNEFCEALSLYLGRG